VPKVLVTGAGGFIGSHLVELLVKEGVHVRAYLHYNSRGGYQHLEEVGQDVLANVELVKGDIADPFSVGKAVAGCDAIFHLAALIGIPYSYVAPASYVSTNIIGTLNILEAARANDVSRVIHTSTSETYGSAQYVPMDEAHPLVGQSPYSASKIAADKLAESFWLSFGTPVTTVRPFNTYGPRQSARAIIPTIIGQALEYDEISLGNLEPIRDLTYVSDTAAGFLAAWRSEKAIGEVLNLGVGTGISIGDLVSEIARLINKDVSVQSVEERARPDASEVDRLISNNTKAHEITGWQPAITLAEGLQLSIDYIRKHGMPESASTYII
jgi:NAD dependent epimerase/dehydratase